MKPMVSPYFLRGMYEHMAQLERYAKAWSRERNAIVKGKFLPALWDAYSIAMAQYLPAPLEVPVTFYAAEHDGRAWRHLSSRVEVLQVPGGHGGCLTIGADLLVDHLRQRIDALAGGARSAIEPHTRTPSSSAKADDPVRRGFSIPLPGPLEYWVTRLRG